MQDLSSAELSEVSGGLTREQFANITCQVAWIAVGTLFGGSFGAAAGKVVGGELC